MVILSILYIFIAILSQAVEIQSSVLKILNDHATSINERVSHIPFTPKKDLWLTPKEGILVNEHTQVYLIEEGPNNETLFREIPRAIEDIVLPAMSNKKYQKASVENIGNPDIQHSTQTSFFHQQSESAPAFTAQKSSEILYIEIMVVVAHDLYQKLGKNLSEVIPHMLAFWNGVDLHLRPLINPKIRLNLAKIMIETEEGLLHYMKPHSESIKFWHYDAFDDSYKFWFKQNDQIPLESYDIAVTLTTQGFCTEESTLCEKTDSGRGIIGSLCMSPSSKLSEPLKAIIVRENGTFLSTSIVAHELGHSLGIYHDGDKAVNYMPSCGAAATGKIMDSSGMFPHEEFYKLRWSQCSLEQLDKLIRSRKLSCLHNPPKAGKIHVPRLLPGKLVNLDDHCQSRGFVKAAPKRTYPCESPVCTDKANLNYNLRTEIPEGAACDETDPDRFCLSGRCISPSDFT